LWHNLGETNKYLKLATELIENDTNQAPALALGAYLAWEAGDGKTSDKAFKQLRNISSRFDLDTPIFARLSPIAEHLGLPAEWRKPTPKKKDTGKRPSLDSLGPFRWEPYNAPAWTLSETTNRQVSLTDYKGHPVLVVFYLGNGCAHCLEQLSLLAPAAIDFKELGITIIAVSSDSLAGVTKLQEKRENGYPFTIVSDQSLKIFKAYRAYDDFEQMPLHGTFLVDGAGKVRWQDISYEPFRDMKFLVGESRRLLGLARTPPVALAH
jgi:peroxiredoxin